MAGKITDAKRILVIALIATLALFPFILETGWAGSRFSGGKAPSGSMPGFHKAGGTSFRAPGPTAHAPTQMKARAGNGFSAPARSAMTLRTPQRSFNRGPAFSSYQRTPGVSTGRGDISIQRSTRNTVAPRFTASKPTAPPITNLRRIKPQGMAGFSRGKAVTGTNATRVFNRTTDLTQNKAKGSFVRSNSLRQSTKNTNDLSTRTASGRKLSAFRGGLTSGNRESYGNTSRGSARTGSSALYGISKRDHERYDGGTPGSYGSGAGACGRYERPHIKGGDHHGCQRFGYYPSRVFYPVVWPGYYYPVYYDYGPYPLFWYVYPYYHRKYVFVSLDGYWPIDYGYLRYYWYGCHPYYWYGYYPLAYRVGSDAGSYYTYNSYNYYNDDASASSGVYQPDSEMEDSGLEDSGEPRVEVPEEPGKEPQEETSADRYFEEGVKAFEAGDYQLAAVKFTDALLIEPDDMVLPFAHIQALVANQQYEKAAEALRSAVKELPSDQAGIFFPRGLYPSDEVLFGHIDRLETQAKKNPYDPDLQLLLGYQFLGVGKYDQAEEPLRNAGLDQASMPSSQVMLALLEKLKE